MNIEEKTQKVKEILTHLESVVVAYSGGVDSTLLLKIAFDTLGEKAIGITAISASLPSQERSETEKIALQIGAKHQFITSHETDDPNYLANTPDRCFFCKNDLFDRLVIFANHNGYDNIVDGTNADDAHDHRPGRRAAEQYGVRSPLQEAGLTKAEIREVAKSMGLPNWDKPAAACLSSRIPYGTPITLEVLSQVDRAELVLHQMGLHQLRVRHHDKVARIEVDTKDFEIILQKRQQIVDRLKEIGYNYITLDLSGFRSGSMNEVLKISGHK